MVGTAIALTGLMLVRGEPTSRIFGVAGLAIGLGWTTGAAMIDFAVIVPFPALARGWLIVLGITLCTGRLPFRVTAAQWHGAPP